MTGLINDFVKNIYGVNVYIKLIRDGLNNSFAESQTT